MNKGIFLIAGAVLMIGSSSFAGMKCVSYAPDRPPVELEVYGNRYYGVTLHGQSRNTYKAIYQSPEFSRADMIKLRKIVDQSTLKDMPNDLILSYDGQPTHSPDVDVLMYKISGLIPGQVVQLFKKNCVAN